MACRVHYTIKKKLIGNKIAITTDLWSSALYISIIGITCYYIGKYYFISFVLAFVTAPTKHTAVNVKQMILKVLGDFDVDYTNVVSVTCDGASNNLFDKLVLDYKNEPHFVQHHWERHLSNLLMKDAEKDDHINQVCADVCE